MTPDKEGTTEMTSERRALIITTLIAFMNQMVTVMLQIMLHLLYIRNHLPRMAWHAPWLAMAQHAPWLVLLTEALSKVSAKCNVQQCLNGHGNVMQLSTVSVTNITLPVRIRARHDMHPVLFSFAAFVPKLVRRHVNQISQMAMVSSCHHHHMITAAVAAAAGARLSYSCCCCYAQCEIVRLRTAVH